MVTGSNIQRLTRNVQRSSESWGGRFFIERWEFPVERWALMAKPILIYDGECRFCCRWIEAWKVITGDRVEYATSQEAGARFPQIAQEEFSGAVQWVGADGSRCAGAKAVFSALATSTWYGRAALDLCRAPVFAGTVEAAYRMVARNREFFSLLTRWLWGNDVRPPTYAMSSWVFLRVLGGIYLVAFLSFGVQIDGLIGSKGILPAGDFFAAAGRYAGNGAFWQWPSVLWWTGAGDAALHGWCWAGVVVAALLMVGIAPGACLIFLWADYLSLTIAGQDFYQFQWDILLLEAGFLAIFLTPWVWWSKKAAVPPRSGHFLLIWLLFRFLFSSGMVKLTSGDPSWTNGTALDFHYFTQPLPTPLAWYAQQLPGWFQSLSVKGMFFAELVLPFFLFLPRRPRLCGAGGIAALQVMILLTGNYGFFNLLTLALCLLAVDDVVWGKLAERKRIRLAQNFLPGWLLRPVAGVLFAVSLVPLTSAFRQPWGILAPLGEIYAAVAPFRSMNGYGLFAVMTKERKEILVQGSDDGRNWKTYVFRYKPGDPRRAPPWVAPYMPRLDWQMWFAALGSAEQNPWFERFMLRLLEGSPPVLNLLESDPFVGGKPRYVRALADDYTFTTVEEARQTGNWWKTEPAAIYFLEASLKGE
jgi:predicted DCC family thiol-disulfide oxidoreductase YuxK